MVLWLYPLKVCRFCIFSIIFSKIWCQLTSKWLIFDWKSNHLRHKQTKKIDIKHYENHWKVVLWPSTQHKLTILRIFDQYLRQIDINWRQYVCYLNKYSSDTLKDCRNWYKPLWKPSKSGIVAIYTTKIDDFAHFRSFSTSNWRQLTS